MCKKKDKGNILKDTWIVLKLLMLVVATTVVVYLTNRTLMHLYFAVLIVLMMLSDNNLLWTSFVIVLIVGPGRLFVGNEASNPYNLLIPIGGFGRVAYTHVFCGLLWIKAIAFIIRRKYVRISADFVTVVLMYLLYLLYSIAAGPSETQIVGLLTQIIYLSIYLSVRLLVCDAEMKSLRLLMYTILALGLFSQLLYYTSLEPIVSMLSKGIVSGRKSLVQEVVMISEFIPGVTNIVRYVEIPGFLVAVFPYAIYNIYKNKDQRGGVWDLVAAFSCIFMIFMSGTRGWSFTIIATLVLVLLRFPMSGKASWRAIISFILAGVFFISSNQVLSMQVRSAFARFSTLSLIVQGDISAGGSDSRIEVGMSRIDKGLERPLFGWGVSKETEYLYHTDLGMQVLFMQVGFVGMIVLLILLIRHYVFLRRSAFYDKHIFVYIAGVIGIILAHSTSNTLFCLFSTQYNNVSTPLYFALVNRSIAYILGDGNNGIPYA